MPKSSFIPDPDHDFQAWLDHLMGNLTPDNGTSEADLIRLKAASDDFHLKTARMADAAALAKQATADKNASRQAAETLVRAEVRRIKARSDYTTGLGAHLGIEGPENTFDIITAKPDLNAVDKSGGLVFLSFSKYTSSGITIYSKRENDADWVKLARVTVSPYQDNRPLLQTGKLEMRHYTAVYMLNDDEVSQFSNEIAIGCVP